MADTIYSMFMDIVSNHGSEPAVIENGRTLTFSQLSDMVEAIARGFPADLRAVGIVMRHRAEMIAAILAVLRCGAMYVPAEPDFPVGRVHDMMTEADVDFILTEQVFARRLEGFDVRYIDCEICCSDPQAPGASVVSDSERPAYVLYTSGTTGRPKGVCVRNRNVCHYIRAFADEFHLGPGDVMLQYSVCSFDIFVEEVFASLLNGAALAIPYPDEKEGLASLMGFVERSGVTIISCFPYLIAEINHLDNLPRSLRLLVSGGDVLRGIYADRLLGRVEVYNTYGPSETTVCATYHRCTAESVLDDGTYPIGHPVRGASITIIDGDGNEVPRGAVGEICIGGGGVSMGYIGDHVEENRAFVHRSDGSVFYRSGDLGYMLPDGEVAFLHRKDDQIMIYGKRVEVSEVESRLYSCHGVRQALVRAFRDEDGLSYMIAYVVPSEGGVKMSALRRELSENLTEFMIPEFFVTMDSIPLNINGKPDTSRLPVVLKEGRYGDNRGQTCGCR